MVIEKLIDKRMHKGTVEYHVKWKGGVETTWETRSDLDGFDTTDIDLKCPRIGSGFKHHVETSIEDLERRLDALIPSPKVLPAVEIPKLSTREDKEQLTERMSLHTCATESLGWRHSCRRCKSVPRCKSAFVN